MLSFQEKILYLETLLDKSEENYADSFKTDIKFFLNDFEIENKLFSFLHNLKTSNEIDNWINKLTSRIVMKEDQLEVNDIINDYFEFG